MGGNLASGRPLASQDTYSSICGATTEHVGDIAVGHKHWPHYAVPRSSEPHTKGDTHSLATRPGGRLCGPGTPYSPLSSYSDDINSPLSLCSPDMAPGTSSYPHPFQSVPFPIATRHRADANTPSSLCSPTVLTPFSAVDGQGSFPHIVNDTQWESRLDSMLEMFYPFPHMSNQEGKEVKGGVEYGTSSTTTTSNYAPQLAEGSYPFYSPDGSFQREVPMPHPFPHSLPLSTYAIPQQYSTAFSVPSTLPIAPAGSSLRREAPKKLPLYQPRPVRPIGLLRQPDFDLADFVEEKKRSAVAVCPPAATSSTSVIDPGGEPLHHAEADDEDSESEFSDEDDGDDEWSDEEDVTYYPPANTDTQPLSSSSTSSSSTKTSLPERSLLCQPVSDSLRFPGLLPPESEPEPLDAAQQEVVFSDPLLPPRINPKKRGYADEETDCPSFWTFMPDPRVKRRRL
ncbi:hypothetical protein JAAARDRAFT_29038 [Jaapia argillacea MUCL 33604]|uniref:Uncharacterized protein n=1 Tax=Jaapia argillacea MUCL 33604 TaxID=933084 RepID=A0A067QA50_9AGAM|nr:hypothetical protein JAAARDRAFT_29038 [Jaapia argillacea MUCL 33604]